MYKIFPAILCLCILAQTSFATDTVRINKPTSVTTLGSITSPGSFLITNKAVGIPFEGTFHRGLLDWINLGSFARDITFKGCRLSYNDRKEPYQSKSMPRTFNTLIFDSCVFGITISKALGTVAISNSKISSLVFDSCQGTNIQIGGNREVRFVEFLDCRNISLNMQSNSGIDSFDFRCFNSRIRDFQVFGDKNETGSRRYNFAHDTIDQISGGSAGVEDSGYAYRRSGPFRHIFYFDKCYINADVSMIFRLFNSCIFFNECTFGPNANMDDLLVDRVTFVNCRNFSKQLFIGWREKNIPAELRLINTDVSNLNIAWSDSVKLYFDSSDKADLIDNTFESLLAKYQSEGRHDSYRHVDLQRIQRKESNTWNTISKWWWGNGYAQQRVYTWAIIFIVFFTIVNYFCWRHMQEVYKVFDEVRYHGSNLRHWIKKVFVILLYTIFVFFSINIKLDKLAINRSGYVLLFLFQYFLGLFTLLFILKAVLKL